jgi:hypothetical protein
VAFVFACSDGEFPRGHEFQLPVYIPDVVGSVGEGGLVLDCSPCLLVVSGGSDWAGSVSVCIEDERRVSWSWVEDVSRLGRG